MTFEQDAPVIVVGAGPVGLALAGDLGWRGIPCLVLEQGDGSIEQPRMDLCEPTLVEIAAAHAGLVGDDGDAEPIIAFGERGDLGGVALSDYRAIDRDGRRRS